jgi:hypothetical protein
MQIPSRNIIFLQCVYYDKIESLEDILLDQQSKQQNNQSHQDISQTPKIFIKPNKFKSKKQWIDCFKNENVSCWYCSLSFRGVPLFIAKCIRNTPTGREYDTHGLFCGASCAYSYLINSAKFLKDKTFSDKLLMLKSLYRDLFNKKIIEFIEAPCPHDMTQYGGNLERDQYKDMLKDINHKIKENAIQVD